MNRVKLPPHYPSPLAFTHAKIETVGDSSSVEESYEKELVYGTDLA